MLDTHESYWNTQLMKALMIVSLCLFFCAMTVTSTVGVLAALKNWDKINKSKQNTNSHLWLTRLVNRLASIHYFQKAHFPK